MKKTAVDYLIKEVSAILGQLKTEPMQDLLLVDAINKANKMFEQQIIDAANLAVNEWFDIINYNSLGEQYYKETYDKTNR